MVRIGFVRGSVQGTLVSDWEAAMWFRVTNVDFYCAERGLRLLNSSEYPALTWANT